MTPERLRQVEALYHAARARPEREWAAFLAKACAGDAALREEVASLLTQPVSALTTEGVDGAPPESVADRTLIGRRLGVYQLQGRLGAGGMGEVYHARDTRLGREVAIKILPPAFTSDPDRLARFEREARVLASLNHPHIAAIYGVEEADGIKALVLELVEGETLADRIARAPVPVAEARVLAEQMADALEAAHARGIVHRDLKPANVKLTAGGRVKVLDFGLAKIADGGEDEHTQSAVAGMTRTGMVLGTAAYMSPEQARGQAVDKRTDIWAFGCVLYELLTGRPVFARATLSDTLAAVVHNEPDWTRLPHDLPSSLVRLLTRCLQKDQALRLRDIGDARLELADIEAAAAPTVNRNGRIGRFGLVTGISLAAGALAIGAAIWIAIQDPKPPAQRSVRFTIPLQPDEQFQLDAGLPRPLAISSDGRAIAYVTRRPSGNRLYLRREEDVEGQPIVGTEGGIGPFFSPDGQWIGFASGGFLKKVSVNGGSPQPSRRR
jgi:eukaryotic-like serine/threonine-protein kinase